MNKKLLILLILFLPMLCISYGCSKEKENETSNLVEGYIVASFRCGEIDQESGQGIGELSTRGFFIMLENNADSMYSFNLPESLFNFPQEILEPNHNVNNCGPIFFPDDKEYKISFKYRACELSEKIEFACGCFTMLAPFDWGAFKQVVISEVEIK